MLRLSCRVLCPAVQAEPAWHRRVTELINDPRPPNSQAAESLAVPTKYWRGRPQKFIMSLDESTIKHKGRGSRSSSPILDRSWSKLWTQWSRVASRVGLMLNVQIDNSTSNCAMLCTAGTFVPWIYIVVWSKIMLCTARILRVFL